MFKHIWIFNHYAQSATLPGGTRHFDLAKELIKKGHKVTIFAASFHYTLLEEPFEYKNYRLENIEGVDFIWIKTYPYKVNNWKRLLNIASYASRLNRLLPKLNLQNPDIIIGSSVHPFAAMVASRFAKIYNVPFVFEIRDLWPQTFIDMGLWKKKSLLATFFKFIESMTVGRSAKIIVLSPLTIDYLEQEYSFNSKNTLLLPNGVNNSFIGEIQQNFQADINITYLGGIDKVHGLEFLINLASEMKTDKVIFNIYGDGKERNNLEKIAKEKNLYNVVFHGSVKKLEVPDTLKIANLLFVSTSNVLYGSENKLYEYMATAKPIIVATSGNHNNPIKDIDCGLVLDRSDVRESAKILVSFIKERKMDFKELGKNGQDYVVKNRTINLLSEKLEAFLFDKQNNA